MYDKGDIEAVENKLKEFFQIQEEKTQNAQKAEPFRTKTSAGYIPTTISEEAYKLIRYWLSAARLIPRIGAAFA